MFELSWWWAMKGAPFVLSGIYGVMAVLTVIGLLAVVKLIEKTWGGNAAVVVFLLLGTMVSCANVMTDSRDEDDHEHNEQTYR